MRAHLDEGLKQRGLEAVVVCGGPATSWETAYIVGPLKVTWGYVLKRLGEDPVFIVKGIDRHEASKGRAAVVSYDTVGLTSVTLADLPRAVREADMIEGILDYYDVKGRVALYGSGPISNYAQCLHILRERRPETFPHYEGRRSLFQEASMTKEADEIDRIANVGMRVEDVFRNTCNYLTTLISEGGRIFDIEGEPIAVGDIKDMVVREAGRRRFDVPVDVSFAQGPLSAIPNNRGESHETLLAGVPVIFDLVGRERRGYHYEVTRTFCIGETNARFEEVYEIVTGSLAIAVDSLRPGRTAHQVNDAVSEHFEKNGLPTLRQGSLERGFVHFLGHGIGLELYEEPRFGPVEEELELTAGMVVMLEPGIYLPEEGFGIRLGDVAVVQPDGPARVLSNVAKNPLLPLSR